jgi:hypothetical protein
MLFILNIFQCKSFFTWCIMTSSFFSYKSKIYWQHFIFACYSIQLWYSLHQHSDIVRLQWKLYLINYTIGLNQNIIIWYITLEHWKAWNTNLYLLARAAVLHGRPGPLFTSSELIGFIRLLTPIDSADLVLLLAAPGVICEIIKMNQMSAIWPN